MIDQEGIYKRHQSEHAEDTLQKIQNNYIELVELTNSIILRWDPKGRITFLNKFGQTFFGYKAGEILGRNVVGTIVPETDQAGHDLIEMIRDIGIHPELYVKNQNENMLKNGERVWISWTNKPIFDEIGNVMEILSVGNDHTDLKRAEEELLRSKEELETQVAERTANLLESNERLNIELEERRRAEILLSKSERKYRLLYDIAPIGIVLVDNEGKILEVNRSILEILGSPGPDATKAINMFTFPPLVEAGISDLFKTCMLENRPIDTELFYTSKWGKEICLRTILTPKLDDHGNVEGCLAVMEDVIRRKIAQDSLRESEQRYKALYSMMRLMCDNVPDLIWAKDLDRRFLFTNKAVCEKLLLAVDTEEPVGKNDMFFVERARESHPDTTDWHTFGEICIDSDAVVMNTQKSQRFDEFGNVKGEFLYLDVHKSPFLNEQGHLIGTVGCGRDVTLERTLEKALSESEEKYRLLFENAPTGIAFVDKTGRILEVNPRMVEVMGSPSAEKTKEINVLSFRPLVDAGISERYKNCITKGEKADFEVPYTTKWGKKTYLRIRLTPVYSSKGELIGCLAVYEDIMPQKLAEQAQMESEEKYRIIFRDAPVGMMSVNKSGEILEANCRILEILGSPGLEYTRKVNMITNPRVIEAGIADHYRRCLTEGIAADFESPYTTKWGKVTHLRSVLTPKYNDLGEISGCLTVIEDVAARKRAEYALRYSENRYRRLFQSLKDLIDMHSEAPQNESPTVETRSLPSVSKNLELNYIENALRRTRGKVQPAARLLGISRFTLARQMAKMGIKGDNYK